MLAGYLQQTGSASVQGALAVNYPLSHAAHPGLNVSHQLLESVQRVAASNPELAAAAARQALANPQPPQQEPLQGIQQQQAQPQVGRAPPGEAIPSVAAAQGAGNAGAGGELSYASVQDWTLEQLGKVIYCLKLYYIISRDSNQHQRTFFTK